MISIFQTLDLNSNGFVSKGRIRNLNQFGIAFESSGLILPGIEKLKQDFQLIDKDKDGRMSREEWKAYRKMLKAENLEFKFLFVRETPEIYA